MEFDTYYIDHLIDARRKSRKLKNWKLSDDIRDYLDTKHVFIFDTPDGQEVWNMTKGIRQDVIDRINSDKRAEAIFDAWLFSTKSK